MKARSKRRVADGATVANCVRGRRWKRHAAAPEGANFAPCGARSGWKPRAQGKHIRDSLLAMELTLMTSQAVAFGRVLLPAVCAAVLLGACSKAQTPPAALSPPQVSVVTVHRTTVPVSIELPGRTNPYLVAQVRARVDGIVLKRDYKEGTEVKAAQRLYQIDPAPYIAALNSAKASLQKAQAGLATNNAQVERYKVLVAGNAVSKQDYDNAVASQGQSKPTSRRARPPWLRRRSILATPTWSRQSAAARASRRSRRALTSRRAPRRP
jgi:multidrug efflux pump subunit AcrA (membrane-fusion protein)